MKANETPEKIYINSSLEDRIWLIGKGDTSFIEYTRTDAFLEKAEKWLEENVMKYLITTIHAGMDVPDIKDDFFDDFKKHLKRQ